MATAPLLYRSLKYKPLEDFEYLGLLNEVPMTLVTRPTMSANGWPELVKWLDGRAERAQLAHAGIGSASHLCGLLFQAARKADLQTVAYKGTGPAMTDLIAGKVDLMCDQTSNTLAPIEAGKIKAYAVTTSRRLSGPLAKLPTLDEAGLKGFNITIWHGVYAPKGTPKAVLDKLHGALKTVMQSPDFQKRQHALGAEVVTDARSTPAEHRKFVQSEIAKWGPIMKAAAQYGDWLE